ncbi:filament-like plant protein 7 isoform X1, partial [Tanacetum coccineum]
MELRRNLKFSDEKLSAALAEINAKDEIAKKQTNIGRESIQGWEKSETKVLNLQQELEKATQQRLADEERLHGVDASLKECMLQLRFVREEQEKRIHDAVTKTSTECEKQRLSEKDDNLSLYKTSETPTGYTVHVFQWKTSELQGVLEEFLQSCNKMVNGKAGVEDFIKELTSDMKWIVNHCFSLQDVSSMKDDIKKQFDWDETRNECEVEGGTNGRLSEADKLDFPKDQSPGWPMANIRNKIFHLEPNVREEVRKLKDDVANLESANKYLENLKDQTEEGIVEKDIDKHPIETINECNEAHQEPISIKEQE